MTHKGHSGGGFAAGVCAVGVIGSLPISESLLPNLFFFLTAILAGLMPDIDHRGSWISRRLPWLSELYKLGLSNPLTWRLWTKGRMERLAGHRSGLTHSLLGPFSAVGVGLVIFLGARALIPMLSPALLPLMAVRGLMGGLPVDVGLAGGTAVAWFLGWWSHILLDMLTYSGVALIPWSEKRYGLLPQFMRMKMQKWGVSDG